MRSFHGFSTGIVLAGILLLSVPARAQDAAGEAAGAPAPKPDAGAAAQPEAAKPDATKAGPQAPAAETSATAAVSADSASAPAPAREGGVALSFGGYLGGGVRLDEPPAYGELERGGLQIGGMVAVWPTKWLGISVGYEHLDLSTDRASSELGTFDVERELSTIWGTLRLTPWHEGAVPYLALGAGVAWQSLGASGTTYPFPQGTQPITTRCDGSDSASLALRVAAGLEGRFPNGVVLFAETGPDMIRLDDAPLDACAAGAGTVMELGLRAGAQYRFDLTPKAR